MKLSTKFLFLAIGAVGLSAIMTAPASAVIGIGGSLCSNYRALAVGAKCVTRSEVTPDVGNKTSKNLGAHGTGQVSTTPHPIVPGNHPANIKAK